MRDRSSFMGFDKSETQGSEDEIRFGKLLYDQLCRYPRMEIQDLYKLIHQGAMGSEHAVKDEESARSRLLEEINYMQPGPIEPAVDPISIGGEIVRINLRPYIKAGGDPQALLYAFVRTANEYQGSPREIIRCWNYVEKFARSGDLKYQPDALSDFITRMSEKAYPAVHHSEMYVQSYYPAYRVVAFSILNEWKQGSEQHSGISWT
jgi:hypothetical protein